MDYLKLCYRLITLSAYISVNTIYISALCRLKKLKKATDDPAAVRELLKTAIIATKELREIEISARKMGKIKEADSMLTILNKYESRAKTMLAIYQSLDSQYLFDLNLKGIVIPPSTPRK